MSRDRLYRVTGRESLTFQGVSPEDVNHAVLTNLSGKPLTFMCDDGSQLEIAVDAIVSLPTRPDRVYRLACNSCGRFDGTHTPECLPR
jgi:hypothetical protein